METPQLYGWFHLMCLALVVVASVFLGRKMKNATDEQVQRFIRFAGISMFVLEIYKQLVFSFTWDGASVTWKYQWYAFPFQFCAMPMYANLLAGFWKKGKVRDALYCFLATFTLFGGLAVMLYPTTCFTDIIGINVHTMYHHGLMIVIPVVLLCSGKVKFEWKTVLKAVAVFIPAVLIALGLNLIYVAAGGVDTFNMFFISPYYPCTLPVASLFYGDVANPLVPYPVFLLIYVLGFTICAAVAFSIPMFIRSMCTVCAKSKQKRKALPEKLD